jgi:DNA-binding transcriptional LysR family regulator
MNLRTVDLNLLVVLEALLAERHVSRAALRIGLSQPAMSNALARLRASFGDALLVRTPAGMELTDRARELADPVALALREAERVFTVRSKFDPATCDRRFVLRMSDLLGRLFLPHIAAALSREAPQASLEVAHLSPARTVHALETDACDAAISMGLSHGGAIRGDELLADRMVCVLRQGHPAARRRLDIAGFLALDHLRVSISPVDRRFVDDVLARSGKSRRVVLNAPHWLVVPDVLRATDLAAVMPARLAQVVAAPAQGFLLRELPFETTAFHWTLYWHRRREGSAEHAWFRRLLVAAIRAASNVGSADREPSVRASRPRYPR